MTKSKCRKKFPAPRIPNNFVQKLKALVLQDLQQCVPVVHHPVLEQTPEPSKWAQLTLSTAIEESTCILASSRLLGELDRKYLSPGDSGSRRTAAIDSFKESERSCSRFNTIGWRKLESEKSFLKFARYFVKSTIGEMLPSCDILSKRARHGPGASIGSRANKSHPYFKYVQWPYSVTIDTFDHARLLIENDDRWLGALEDSYRRRFSIPMTTILNWTTFWESVFVIVPGNRVTTVSKDSSKDRTIAIEPTMNQYLQLGVDGFIRKRLKRWDIDLDDQMHNCILSHRGSLSNRLATLDLSAASDTVSLRICKLLLPACWYEHLCDLRSPRGDLPGGETLRYSKISSMGNGYTFALESLIFGAITYASARLQGISWNADEFAIYGDDIICPNDLAPRLIANLELCGFATNASKSFFGEEYFRESCGTDWYYGLPVRAVYLKEPVTDVIGLYRLHNSLLKWSTTVWGTNVLTASCDYLRRIIPHTLRNLGPCDNDDLSSYIMDPDWVMTYYTRPGKNFCKVRPFSRVVKRTRTVKLKEWFFGRLLASHCQTEPFCASRVTLPVSVRGEQMLELAPSAFRKDSGGTLYEASLRDQTSLRLVKGYRLIPGVFGQSVRDHAECVNRGLARHILTKGSKES